MVPTGDVPVGSLPTYQVPLVADGTAPLTELKSLVALIGAPASLSRLTDTGHHPRLGAAAWGIAIASVVASWLGANMTPTEDSTTSNEASS